jgi:hypothetical protein
MENKMMVYLMGPMRGLPDHNAERFYSAASQLKAMGFSVFNPAEFIDDSKTIAQCLDFDVPYLIKSDFLLALPGWQFSEGAIAEHAVANTLNIPTLTLQDLMSEDHLQDIYRIAIFRNNLKLQHIVEMLLMKIHYIKDVQDGSKSS